MVITKPDRHTYAHDVTTKRNSLELKNFVNICNQDTFGRAKKKTKGH